jgi:hypothetical protein
MQGLRALALARAAGVRTCFGSDLLGELHPQQAQEFRLRASVQPPAELLQAATVNCAQLFMMEQLIGQVGAGAGRADDDDCAGGRLVQLRGRLRGPGTAASTAALRPAVAAWIMPSANAPLHPALPRRPRRASAPTCWW